MGGENADGSPSDLVHLFDPEEDSFEKMDCALDVARKMQTAFNVKKENFPEC